MGDPGGRIRQHGALQGLPGLPRPPVTATDTRPAGPAPAADPPAAPAKGSVVRSGALMAAGSIVSRATGFVRSAVVVAALGTGLMGDGYAVANTVPNILYMLLIGGALNAVFVPELVRAAKEHKDGGAAYTDRLLTACTAALVLLTAVAVLAAPLIVAGYTGYTGAQASTTVALARFCLPQILFYGLFTLLGQVLNARGRFGAMMWTPILNNLVIIGVFGLFLSVSHGSADGLTAADTRLLGLGTTAGIVIQALALIPSLRAAGFRWRPRFDWRGSGLARPLRNAGWLVMLVLTNQISYWVVTRLSTATGRHAHAAGLAGGAGYTAYSNAYQLWIVPQGIITVSLVTALMPRMSSAATDGDLAAVRRDVSYALRSSAALVVPAAVIFVALAPWVMGGVFEYGRTTAADIEVMAGMLMAFAPGLIAFSGQYVLSRGFYALSDTRTPFFLNLVIAGLWAALSIAAYLLLPPRWAVTGMAGAYSVALFAGLAVTAYTLARRLGPRAGTRTERRATAVRTHLRLLAACLPAGAAGYAAARAAERFGDFAAVGAGTAAIALVVVLLAGPLRLTEITDLLDSLRRKIRR
ncbi:MULTISPECIES: murein biosynthesis integral membrane protein MurJ [unclassified Streptomyces]|uniref:murein biosynthesis integral membrane protein MurJ n=1 Tax=unclassified Streptomyces TaxID=2593676 RepID=UPI002250DCBF|nr:MULTISPECIES: murein biosynthesis integral membrane protein MurJ [unclassified Streptomyces]MCX4528861.1 murein biosynthesis integral membrane protein MurJ [Streptomyces sp. NBC_01551]MCX4540531.1 murein biosynthesis integral membrane protein MurJ [Streptomyces sp. NBC_01565]